MVSLGAGGNLGSRSHLVSEGLGSGRGGDIVSLPPSSRSCGEETVQETGGCRICLRDDASIYSTVHPLSFELRTNSKLFVWERDR